MPGGLIARLRASKPTAPASTQRSAEAPAPRSQPVALPFLVATSLVCGALVMVLEVLGSRVIGPYFGVSLFVWTALITVTLVGLAAGYAVGGWLSDRHPSADWLYGIIFLAGVAVLAIPWLKEPVPRACIALGLRTGALASAAVLFLPPLFLLGCVSPYIVKVAAREVGSIGRLVGALSAVSTAGSFAGTVLTGFVLIAAFGVGRIFQAVGVVLLLLAGTYFAVVRRRWWLIAPAILAAALPQHTELRSGVAANGNLVAELYRSDSFYGHLDVVEIHEPRAVTRALIVDGAIQGGVDQATGLSAYPYPYFLQFLPVGLRPGGTRCLVVGLGAGMVPRWYEQHGVTTDVVEIDPEIVEVTRQQFGLPSAGKVVVDDARHFLNVTQEKYDYVVLDAFAADTFPGHLLSREALTLTARAMKPDGVLAMNLVGGLRPGDRVVSSVVRTLATVFEQVEVRPIFNPLTQRFGNVEVAAYHGPPRAPDRALIGAFQVVPAAYWATSYLWHTYPVDPDEGEVLTDERNPLDSMDLEAKETLRQALASARGEWDLSWSR